MSTKHLALLANTCQDKIEILHDMKRDTPQHVLQDMLADKSRHSLAIALLISLNKNIVRLLLENFSSTQIKYTHNLLKKNFNLTYIRNLRATALHYYYGEISLAEFAHTPLGLRLKDPAHLSPLSSWQILQLILHIKSELLPPLLSCLAPLRVSKSVLLCRNDSDKQKILDGLSLINSVKEKDIDDLIIFFDNNKENFATYRLNPPQTARYLSKMIAGIDKEDTRQLLETLQDKPHLLTELSNYFLPFETISHLEPQEIKEIFCESTEETIASTLFNTDPLTRTVVLNALPDTTRLATNAKLKHMNEDTDHRTTHIHNSNTLQLKIRNYLQANADSKRVAPPLEESGEARDGKTF